MNAAAALTDRLLRAAKLWGKRTALVDHERRLNYGELAYLSGLIAERISAIGVAASDFVAWHGDKNVTAVAAIHGILRAGAAYVPLDPESPIGRNIGILERGRPRALVVDDSRMAHWRSYIPDEAWSPLLSALEGQGPGLWIATLPNALPSTLERAAYVLHTSGSTGSPKGVVHTHESAAAFVDWAAEEFELCEHDIIVSSAPLHFDLTTFDLFAPVLVGASCAIMSRTTSRFPGSCSEFISDVRGTVWYTVPSSMRMLTTGARELVDRLRSLRIVALAGEVLTFDVVDALLSSTQARVYNLYGPTETNVCTYHLVDQDDKEGIPIGRPLPCDAVAVVDRNNRAVPNGSRGQLLVSGSTLMSGYWHQQPASELKELVSFEEKQWYATGDTVVTGEDGALRFVGRGDDQVKIRGHRVELPEIEVALRAFASVRDAAVFVVGDSIRPRISALVEGGSTDLLALTAHLRSTLPPYMVPEKIQFQDRPLPRLSTGKLDRQGIAAALTDGEALSRDANRA